MKKQFRNFKLNRAKGKELKSLKEKLLNLEHNEENLAERKAMLQRLEKLL